MFWNSCLVQRDKIPNISYLNQHYEMPVINCSTTTCFIWLQENIEQCVEDTAKSHKTSHFLEQQHLRFTCFLSPPYAFKRQGGLRWIIECFVKIPGQMLWICIYMSEAVRFDACCDLGLTQTYLNRNESYFFNHSHTFFWKIIP